ncbi:CAP domain-containing protein [Methanospirillum hungatei]|uniref:CAP domain-containing protein n=1 Tax=Methanospirillum hungatei TaxID=2203 RepID=UPI0026F2810C|nr:CAP domain-containing protein [Methanospirillum hungatei]MCA1917298.1 CAP domain-containing protein [Methanospirillum hungatei]
MIWSKPTSTLVFLFICLIIISPLQADLTSEETDNRSTPYTLTPDLSLSDLIIPNLVETGKPISGSVIVTNRGPVPASHISMDVLLTQNATRGIQSIWLGSRGTDVMAPGTRGKIPFSFDVPMGLREGEYFVKVSIRAYEPEIITSDNTITSPEPVFIRKNQPWKGGEPNLQLFIDSVSTNSSSPNSPFTITYRILNTNTDAAGSCRLLFLLSPDRDIIDGYHLREERIFSIYGYMNEQGISDDLIPEHIPPGFYYLIGIIDYTGMIQETDETDNIFVYPDPISISYPQNLYSESYNDQITGYLFLKTNKYREYLGLSPLTFDTDLRTLALDHTTDMIRRSYFSHYTPEGIDPTGRAELMGYDVTRKMDDGSIRTGIAENIIRIAAGHTIGKAYTGFVDPTTPEDVADVMMIEWINSPEHNKNLINPTIEKIGIGTRFDGEYFYATQNFF